MNNRTYKHPIILDQEDPKFTRLLEEIKEDALHIIDTSEEQEKELKELLSLPRSNSLVESTISGQQFNWVYFPEKRSLVKLLKQELYRAVRLSRNQGLISEKEQTRIGNSLIGVAGLNVGNPGAVCITLQGGANKMKFADPDVLDLSNLNRFRATVDDLGVNKCHLTATQVHGIDPYLSLELFLDGITETTIDNFLFSPKLDLLIEEVDNLKLKIRLRKLAREKGIPVLMVTGNGANIIIDVERYDRDPDLELLSGMISKDLVYEIEGGNYEKPRLFELARDFMGKEALTPELYASFSELGKTIAGIPQLSEASFLRGAALSYFSRKILTNQIGSGRFHLKLDHFLEN